MTNFLTFLPANFVLHEDEYIHQQRRDEGGEVRPHRQSGLHTQGIYKPTSPLGSRGGQTLGYGEFLDTRKSNQLIIRIGKSAAE